MRIAYLTTDEVNQDLALSMTEAYGITLCPLSPREAPPDGLFVAVLYDWDYWPADRREQVLVELLTDRPRCPVALHSYNVDPDQAEALRRRGVAVHRRLRTQVFGSLRRAVLAARVAAACGRNGNDARAATNPAEDAA